MLLIHFKELLFFIYTVGFVWFNYVGNDEIKAVGRSQKYSDMICWRRATPCCYIRCDVPMADTSSDVDTNDISLE